MRLKKLITILMTMIIIMSNIMVTNVSMAYTGDKFKIQTNAEYNDIISYDGANSRFIYAFYIDEQGKEQPVYCLDKSLPGVESTAEKSYTVTASGTLSDEQIWRVLHYSYPYVSIIDMGCDNKYQCYAATQAALNCVIYNWDVNKFSALTEEGEPIIEAIKRLVNYANNEEIEPYSSDIEINIINDWTLENINGKIYLSRTFKAENKYLKQDYTVSLRNNVPIGTLIVDLDNTEKRVFEPNEQFKVLIPREAVTKKGKINIEVKAEVETTPIYRGLPDGDYQPYAITGIETESGKGKLEVEYNTIGGLLTINKLDSYTNKKLKGAVFDVYDSKGNVICENLTTNVLGQVKVYNLMTDSYFVVETKAPEGYQKISGKMLVPVKINGTSTLNVMNTQIEVKEEETHNIVVEVVENNSVITNKTENEYYKYETNNNTENNIETNNKTTEVSTNNNIVNDIQNNNTTITNDNTTVQNNNTTTNKVQNNTTTINQIQNNSTTIEETTNVDNNQIQNNINIVKKLPKTGM